MIKKFLRSLARLLLFFSGVMALQYAIAFAYPHLTEGSRFCWVQPRIFENAPPLRRDPKYFLEVIDTYSDLSFPTSLDLFLSGEGSSLTNYTSLIYFGYTDGKVLYGWSPFKFSYYQVPESIFVQGADTAKTDCRKKFGDGEAIAQPSYSTDRQVYFLDLKVGALTRAASLVALLLVGGAWTLGYLSWRIAALAVPAIPIILTLVHELSKLLLL